MSLDIDSEEPSSRSYPFENGRVVTTRRLYPELEKLLLDLPKHSSSTTVDQKLTEALREHVFNEMPLRLILLPERKLVERNAIFHHILAKMTGIDEPLISEMEETIENLGKEEMDEFNVIMDTTAQQELEDARKDPWKAICQFLFHKFAPYAILSHTWLQTGSEIEYRDITAFKDNWEKSESVQGKPGYLKLKSFCDVAYWDHDIDLAWTDTLCINKDSSAELDEAIQSMYKWYQKSSVCITYLGDTYSLPYMGSDAWFKRGWTLQELIAPKKMQFYSCDWITLTFDIGGNDKLNPEVQQIIYKATEIGSKELTSFDPLTGSDIPTRMRWAASRRTTRGEDRAYSLMGIFGVNFSISYGEGAERAFFRLVEAIIGSRRTSHVIQVLHWAGKAVSDKIHTSRLIPSGPECYVRKPSEEHVTMIPSILKPMVLTHLGLRARLLLVRLNEVQIGRQHYRNSYGPFDVELRADNILSVGFDPSGSPSHISHATKFPLERRFSEMPTENSILKFYDPQISAPCGSSFFLGIYTFKEDEHSVYVPSSSCAFLLGIPTASLGATFSIHDISSNHFEATSKIDTLDIIQLHHEPTNVVGGKSVATIKKEGMDMKVVNVYL